MIGRRGIIKWALTVSLVAIPIVGFWQRQNIYDWYKLRGYDPPEVIFNLAAADTMNDKAKRIFYVNRPRLISDGDSFRQECSTSEQTIVLGCYHPNQQGIFVYDVSDDRLSGIEEVTAAHEMLHAAYDRLSGDDKEKVNKLLEDFYKLELKDQRIKDTIEAYKKSEPLELVNEMHSIFGTETTQLPAPLEDYYKRYFANRAAVVAFSQKYEAEFSGRKTRAQQHETQLNELKSKIDAEEAELRAQLQRINEEQKRLNGIRNSGRTDEYNNGVAAYNAQVDAYNDGIAAYKRDIDRYNSVLEQYNAIVGELGQLYDAIDTRLSPKR